MKHFPRLLLLTAVQAALTVVPAWADDEQSGDLKPVGEKLRDGTFPHLVHPGGPAAVRTRRGAAAFVLVLGIEQGLRHHRADRPELRNSALGQCRDAFGNPFTWPLTGKALTDGWAAVDRAKAAGAKTRESKTTSRPSRRSIKTRTRSTTARARSHMRRRWNRLCGAIPTTPKRRFSTPWR